MPRYLAGRLAQGLLVVFIAYTAAFFLLYALPSDPVSMMLGPDAVDVSSTERATLAAEYGLDRPLLVQYFTSLFALFQGDLGFSFQAGREVTSIIAEALSSTAALSALGLVFAIIGGGGIAFAAAYFRRPWLRQALLSLPSLGISIPAFWFGLLLIQVFSFRLGLVPAISTEGLSSMILPAFTLALPTGAMIAQVFARSLIASLAEPYADTAAAKGAGRARVLFAHSCRNSIAPVLTIAGLIVGQLFSGTVVTETVFSRPGLGRVIAGSVSNQDIPVVLGAVLFGAALYAAANLVVDFLYPVIDPRQRPSTRKTPSAQRTFSESKPGEVLAEGART